jgi:DnaJ-class molecular chaperone
VHWLAAGTQHGDQLVLRGAGVASTSGGLPHYGHHYFQVQLVVPRGRLGGPRLQLLQRLRAHHHLAAAPGN